MAGERIAIPGSERQPIPNSNVIGAPDPNEIMSVHLLSRRRRNANLPSPDSGTISRQKFAERFGADAADADLIEQFAGETTLPSSRPIWRGAASFYPGPLP